MASLVSLATHCYWQLLKQISQLGSRPREFSLSTVTSSSARFKRATSQIGKTRHHVSVQIANSILRKKKVPRGPLMSSHIRARDARRQNDTGKMTHVETPRLLVKSSEGHMLSPVWQQFDLLNRRVSVGEIPDTSGLQLAQGAESVRNPSLTKSSVTQEKSRKM